MIKSVLKETFIMVLLCVAIVLVLGVVFYDYIPANKAVPNKLEAYTTPENVKAEIEQEIEGSNLNTEETLVYEITGADLSFYEKTNSFVAGKPDPFSASTTIDENIEDGGTSGGNSSGGSGSTNQTSDPNSTGTYFENTGLK